MFWPRYLKGAGGVLYRNSGIAEGIAALPASLTINSTTKTPDFRFRLGDTVVGSGCAAWGYGQDLVEASTGGDITVGAGVVPGDGAATFTASGKWLQGPSNSFMDYTTEDLVGEAVLTSPASFGAYPNIIFKRILAGAYYGWTVYFNSGGGITLQFRDGTTSKTIQTTALSANTAYHIMWFIDRSGSGLFYVNNAAHSASVASGVGSIASAMKVQIGSDGAATGYTAPLDYVAGWSGIGWLDTHLQAAVVAERWNALTANGKHAALFG